MEKLYEFSKIRKIMRKPKHLRNIEDNLIVEDNPAMQGVVLMPENPQQGSPPPSNVIATDMEESSNPTESKLKQQQQQQTPSTKTATAAPPSPISITNQSSTDTSKCDSGIYSSNTSNETMNQSPSSSAPSPSLITHNNNNSDSDCNSSPDNRRKSNLCFCLICKAMFNSQQELTAHVRSHSNKQQQQNDETTTTTNFTCKICNKVLSSNNSLDRHSLTHSGDRPFNCKYCGDTFTTNGNMHRHMRTHKNGEDVVSNQSGGDRNNCYESDSDGSSDGGSTNSSKNHMEYNNNNNNKKIDNRKRKPKKKYNTDNDNDDDDDDDDDNDMHVHYRKRSKNNRAPSSSPPRSLTHSSLFQCPVCKRTDFDTETNLNAHLEDNHPEHPVKCNKCEEICLSRKSLTQHKLLHDANELIPGSLGHFGAIPPNLHSSSKPLIGFSDLSWMEFSSGKFPLMARLECELNSHKPIGHLKFQCVKCSKAFPCLSSLEIHERNCQQQLTLETAFGGGGGLNLTMKQKQQQHPHVSEDEIRRVEFFSRLNLQDNSPEKNQPLANETSNKLREHLARNFDNHRDLADIQSILSNINQFQQQPARQHMNKSNESVNNDSISTSTPIVNHNSKQEPEEESQDSFLFEFRKMKSRGEFPCRLCSAKFPNLRALKGHNRAHLNGHANGTYYCNMCPHSSVDKGALMRHMRTHNGDRPYECSLCNYAFTTKANCERHLRNRHAKSTREEVKKSIIYHPSEDPTNEDLNKLSIKDATDKKQHRISTTSPDSNLDKIHCSTPKMKNIDTPFVASDSHHHLPPPPPPPAGFFPMNFLNHENLKALQRNAIFDSISNSISFLPPPLPPLSQRPSSLQQPQQGKIQVRPFEVLRENLNNSFETQSDDDQEQVSDDEPQALDLSKKKMDELQTSNIEIKLDPDQIKAEDDEDDDARSEEVNGSNEIADQLGEEQDRKDKSNDDDTEGDDDTPQDLTNKSSPVPSSIGGVVPPMFAQPLLHQTPANPLSQVTLYNLASLYGPAWPMLFQPLSGLTQPQLDIKERLKRLQLCGGGGITEDLQNLHQQHQQLMASTQGIPNFNGFKTDLKPATLPIAGRKCSTPIKRPAIDDEDDDDDGKMRIDNDCSRPKIRRHHSPMQQQQQQQQHHSHNKADFIQSPNSVKMVIKNGVLMPKQKQRRYRTERPFTCEHCSAKFTLRSNMERHVKQQHPQYWSARQRNSLNGNTTGGHPGRKPHNVPVKVPPPPAPTAAVATAPYSHHGELSPFPPPHPSAAGAPYDSMSTSKLQRHINNLRTQYNEPKSHINEKLKFALLASQQLKVNNNNNNHNRNHQQRIKVELIPDDDEDGDIEEKNDDQHDVKQPHNDGTLGEEEDTCELVIDENNDKNVEDNKQQYDSNSHSMVLNKANEEDLVSVSRLLDNASQQPFKQYLKFEADETAIGSEEDEEGLVASGSTSEGNVSGTDENRSDTAVTVPIKKKSAYSLAPNRVSCPFCSRKFPWSSSLRRHILTHTGQKPYKCSHCPLLFTTKSNCDRHLQRKHGKNATTITTNDAANTVNYLMRNVPERPFKCSICPSSTFSTYPNLKKHLNSKHPTNAQGDDIKAQGYEASSSEDEKINHIDHHHQNMKRDSWDAQIAYNKFPATAAIPVITPTTTVPANVNSEIQQQTISQLINSDLPFKCHLCEGSFAERIDALEHTREKHSNEYDLLISKNAKDGNATTPDETSLVHPDDDDIEMPSRSGGTATKFPDYSNRKVICAWCMRRFWSAEDLRRHMRTHTGERPFRCDICGRKFTLKHSMLRHRKKHTINNNNNNNSNSYDQDVSPHSGDEDCVGGISGGGNGGCGSIVKMEESDDTPENNTSDLISNLLGLRDRTIIDKVLDASADDAAKLLGVKNNGIKE